MVGIVEPHLRHGLVADHRPGVEASCQCQLRQSRLGGDGTAFVAEGLQAAEGGDREGGKRVEARVGAAVGGQDRQRDALAAGKVLQRGQAVGPVGFAADQPDEDGLCARKRAFDIGVDRDRVFQRDDVGEPQGRVGSIAHPTHALIPRREGAEVAVGEGQHHQIGRVLAQVEGGLGFLKSVAFAKDDVHGYAAPRDRPPHPIPPPRRGEGGAACPRVGTGWRTAVRPPEPCGLRPHRCRHARR